MLVEAVGEALGREFLDLEIELEPANGRMLAYLSEKGEVLSREYGEQTVVVHVRMPVGAMGPVEQSAVAVRPANAPMPIAAGEELQVDVSSISLGDSSSEVA